MRADGGREVVIRRLEGLAVEALQGVGGDAPFALLDFPDYANVGDSAIWLGTIAYFRAHRGREPRYVASIKSFSEARLRGSLPEGPIFVNGGGNFGDLWRRHHRFREYLLDRFPDREIIQLPQSIHFDDPERVARTARAIARHGRFRLFVRDRWSYEFASAHFDCEIALCPDMALFIGPLNRAPPEVDVFYLLRTDKERAVPEGVGLPGCTCRMADWLVESRLAVLASRWMGVGREVWQGRWDRVGIRAAYCESAARARMSRGCRLLSSGRVVITDRLHAHILSLLLGIPHAVLDNNYGKLGRFLDVWTREAPGVHRAGSVGEAERWAAATVGASGGGP
jgi:exopolysaccharide biosynthesis predicted pyruvyltransferase EpsI